MAVSFRERVYQILEAASPDDKVSRAFDIFIMSLIFLNALAVILETVESFQRHYGSFFRWFEFASVVIFSIEYLLRLWSCTADPRYSHPFFGRIRFFFTPFALIDLAAILPFYLPVFFHFDIRFVRILRFFRIFRIFKLGRYSESISIFGRVLLSRKEELFITIFVVFILLVLASGLMYFVEHSAQPKAFASIPAAMWWGIATLTTVGYGDVYPITPLGRFFGAIIALLGVGLFALPAGIISSGFMEEIQKRRNEEKKTKTCPHCGRELTEE